MATADPNLGRLLDQRYQLLALIGQGAMGRVYQARHIVLEGIVAIKLLSRSIADPRQQERFAEEARICAQLSQTSTTIVRVTDYGLAEQQPYFVMEYLEGETLKDLLLRGSLPLAQFLKITLAVAESLVQAHYGVESHGQRIPIIHRDIKPSNIFITTTGEIKLLDFGIAQRWQEVGETEKQAFLGTLSYASPEQLNRQELDPRTDIYSLGVVMYQMLTGQLPVQAETLMNLNSWIEAHNHPVRPLKEVAPFLSLPRSLQRMIENCLARDRSDRPQTAAELVRVLAPLEERYQLADTFSDRLESYLQKLPTAPPDTETEPTVSAEALCRLQSWPADKPCAQIVFPQMIRAGKLAVPSLWAMFPAADIDRWRLNRLYLRTYRTFFCTLVPRPMLLWVTAIQGNRDQRLRWLKNFLELQQQSNQELLQAIALQRHYRILFFALEHPQRCAYVLDLKIDEHQADQIRQWILQASQLPRQGSASNSREHLQLEFERKRPGLEALLQGSTGSIRPQ
ncbi:serine/threonine-protein kinase [Synechococcus elongatus]|uniref:Serine/threonine protein kinase n=2 Tax=Synechococcus elongatus TaxID=32046 RepID=Q31QN7_SYNE7|nr:serine/threonine-protein kinase [Synechococcus elongatus]ABB56632.1 serine/threonine protein kinase [Synechococcus elongatus PCC 7942 = FACHB-805]AJD58822.1 serine/threonine protein kinase [Synechococcus elongatus UTEX 2973]MBD2588977.1 serine/threonine protein kinase [Synechococcus elongatus FACHB-242]MBD2690043.1 serine/threonine protein kinase [Synechococcus elongatus FACHB-1061]MBD2708486.1 serine/threonine protein kinase [Synechococcus elongatus PCC 7942 = FACHB-805]